MTCGFAGCGRKVKAKGWCNRHYIMAWLGRPLVPIRDSAPRALQPNPGLPGTLLVPLTRGYFAIIDEADGEAVGRFSWSASVNPDNRTVYAKRTVRGDGGTSTVFLHGFLWELWRGPDYEQLDHRDGNGLNNRRGNLRAATPGQNSGNTRAHNDSRSGIKGVRFSHDRWQARICRNGVSRHLGVFDTQEEAAAAYAKAANEEFGEFARAS